MRSARFCAVLAFLLLPALTYAASFDCKLARSPREVAVCTDPKLSAADSQLVAAYAQLRSALSPVSAALIQQDQRDWLRYLDRACPLHAKGQRADIKSCLAEEYGNRVADLKPGPRLSSGHIVFTRDHFSLVPNHPAPDEVSSQDPGFGIARYAWPQVDLASSPEVAWNASIYRAVLRLSAGTDCLHPANLDQCTDPDGQTDVQYSVDADNPNFIISSLETLTYSYGAAHPSAADTIINFSLDARKQMEPDDLFNPATGWKAKLIAPAIAKLHTDKDEQPMLWEGEELRKGVASGLSNPLEWTLTAKGLTISFGQYEVAAYAGGMPCIEFTWEELRPYLAPSFQPAELANLKTFDKPGN